PARPRPWRRRRGRAGRRPAARRPARADPPSVHRRRSTAVGRRRRWTSDERWPRIGGGWSAIDRALRRSPVAVGGVVPSPITSATSPSRCVPTMSRSVRGALVQATWTGDKESMIHKHEGYAHEAAKQGAQFILF